MAESYRQEVLNVVLAQLLEKRGVIAAPENIVKFEATRQRRMPDVLVRYEGLRTMIECEVESANASEKALAAAQRRLNSGIAQMSVAVVYPHKLRSVPFSRLETELEQCEMEIAVLTEVGQTGFLRGDIEQLENALRLAFRRLLDEDIVAEVVTIMDSVIEVFAYNVVLQTGSIGRAAQALGIRELTPGADFSEEERYAIARISGLVLLNALIFQQLLSEHDDRVTPIDEITIPPGLVSSEILLWGEFADHWRYIAYSVNYFAIFGLADRVIRTYVPHTEHIRNLRSMIQAAKSIIGRRAAMNHDLMGRVYHRLLADAKYLGTYYTTIPAAALLLKLTLDPGDGIGWHDLEQISQLRVADLACGTGTLLMSAADVALDNYINASVDYNQPVDLDALQKVLAEKVLYGYDVLPSALHLTASTLALRALRVTFEHMNLYNLPLGGDSLRLGSIEFLASQAVQMSLDLFGTPAPATRVSVAAAGDHPSAPLPDLDVCVMNPPFTRSVGGNLLFGSSPEPERGRMQSRLRRLVNQPHILANTTAGLGSVFVAVADRYIKPAGRLAVVLPKAALSGVAWGKTRDLINQRYHLDYLIVSHDPEKWNFSESTSLSEAMFVATKRAEGHKTRPNHQTVVITLRRNSDNVVETIAVAYTAIRQTIPAITDSPSALPVLIGGVVFAEIFAVPWETMQDDWFLPGAFAQYDLIRAVCQLRAGNLWLPGYGETTPIPLCPLSDLGILGPDRRDIHDGFDVRESPTAYPAFWGRDAETMTVLAQQPNSFLAPLSKAKNGRSLRNVEDLWPKAGRVLVAERLRLNTQSLMAIRVSQLVLSNVWWPLALEKDVNSTRGEKVLTLWLNSTLGILLMLSRRADTEGAWVNFKKPILASLPTLNLRALSEAQLTLLAETYDNVCEQPLLPFPAMAEDALRGQIDSAIARALRLPDFSILRTLLAREPVVCLKRL